MRDAVHQVHPRVLDGEAADLRAHRGPARRSAAPAGRPPPGSRSSARAPPRRRRRGRAGRRPTRQQIAAGRADLELLAGRDLHRGEPARPPRAARRRRGPRTARAGPGRRDRSRGHRRRDQCDRGHGVDRGVGRHGRPVSAAAVQPREHQAGARPARSRAATGRTSRGGPMRTAAEVMIAAGQKRSRRTRARSRRPRKSSSSPSGARTTSAMTVRASCHGTVPMSSTSSRRRFDDRVDRLADEDDHRGARRRRRAPSATPTPTAPPQRSP